MWHATSVITNCIYHRDISVNPTSSYKIQWLKNDSKNGDLPFTTHTGYPLPLKYPAVIYPNDES